MQTNCPRCGSALKISGELAGRRGKCPKCATVFTIVIAPFEHTDVGHESATPNNACENLHKVVVHKSAKSDAEGTATYPHGEYRTEDVATGCPFHSREVGFIPREQKVGTEAHTPVGEAPAAEKATPWRLVLGASAAVGWISGNMAKEGDPELISLAFALYGSLMSVLKGRSRKWVASSLFVATAAASLVLGPTLELS